MNKVLQFGVSLTPPLPSRTKQVERLWRETEPRLLQDEHAGEGPLVRQPIRGKKNVAIAGDKGVQ